MSYIFSTVFLFPLRFFTFQCLFWSGLLMTCFQNFYSPFSSLFSSVFNVFCKDVKSPFLCFHIIKMTSFIILYSHFSGDFIFFQVVWEGEVCKGWRVSSLSISSKKQYWRYLGTQYFNPISIYLHQSKKKPLRLYWKYLQTWAKRIC